MRLLALDPISWPANQPTDWLTSLAPLPAPLKCLLCVRVCESESAGIGYTESDGNRNVTLAPDTRTCRHVKSESQ